MIWPKIFTSLESETSPCQGDIWMVFVTYRRRRGQGRRRQKACWMATPKDTWPPTGRTGWNLYFCAWTVKNTIVILSWKKSRTRKHWMSFCSLKLVFFPSGLSMQLKETKNGCQYFVFEHSHSYQKIQLQFYEAVESLNPQNIGVVIV